jgi:hypothetical protein
LILAHAVAEQFTALVAQLVQFGYFCLAGSGETYIFFASLRMMSKHSVESGVISVSILFEYKVRKGKMDGSGRFSGFLADGQFELLQKGRSRAHRQSHPIHGFGDRLSWGRKWFFLFLYLGTFRRSLGGLLWGGAIISQIEQFLDLQSDLSSFAHGHDLRQLRSTLRLFAVSA